MFLKDYERKRLLDRGVYVYKIMIFQTCHNSQYFIESPILIGSVAFDRMIFIFSKLFNSKLNIKGFSLFIFILNGSYIELTTLCYFCSKALVSDSESDDEDFIGDKLKVRFVWRHFLFEILSVLSYKRSKDFCDCQSKKWTYDKIWTLFLAVSMVLCQEITLSVNFSVTFVSLYNLWNFASSYMWSNTATLSWNESTHFESELDTS